ncbi:MAG: DUF5117 domain-containing protein, partial [Fulvivirga sp.]|uniref:DUF5117 domain-containing protein n=1 Tax=Fulvivirga sp. TaxID=1931237 RepID=UPI0032ED273A
MKNIYLFLFLFIGCTAYANSINTANKNSDGISAKTEGMKKQEGFFNYYYDSKTDKVFLEIDKLDQEFLYVQSLAAGIGSNDIGLDRNQMGRERVVKFIRRGPKILMLQPNYSYLAKSDNEDERKSVEDAFAQSVLWGFRVEAEDKNKVLIDLSDFLMDDAHNVSGRLKS